MINTATAIDQKLEYIYNLIQDEDSILTLDEMFIYIEEYSKTWALKLTNLKA